MPAESKPRVFQRALTLARRWWVLFVVAALVGGLGATLAGGSGDSRHHMEAIVVQPVLADVQVSVRAVVDAVDLDELSSATGGSFSLTVDEVDRVVRVTAAASSGANAERAATAFVDALQVRYVEILRSALLPQRAAEEAVVASIDQALAEIDGDLRDPVVAAKVVELLTEQSSARARIAYIDSYDGSEADSVIVTRSRPGGTVALGNRLAVGLAGAALACALLFLVLLGRSAIDNRLRVPDDIEAVAGVGTVLGRIGAAGNGVAEAATAAAIRRLSSVEGWRSFGVLPLGDADASDLTSSLGSRLAGAELVPVASLDASADAIERAGEVDAWILAVPTARASADQLRDAIDTLLRAGGTIAGIVMITVRSKGSVAPAVSPPRS